MRAWEKGQASGMLQTGGEAARRMGDGGSDVNEMSDDFGNSNLATVLQR